MPHARTQVRNKIVDLLTGLATTGSNVFANRMTVLQDDELPAIIVITGNAQITEPDMQDEILDRVLNVEVVIKVKANDQIDTALDQVMAEVETALNGSQEAKTLDGLCHSLALMSEEVGISESDEKPYGQAVMTFEATFNTAFGNPNNIIF